MTKDSVSVMSPPNMKSTIKPFRFYTSHILQESTGLRAVTLPEVLKLLRTVPESSIYHHTHHFLLQHHYLTPEPTNDFAYWVTEVIKEETLGEILAGIDTLEHFTLHSLRRALVHAITQYLKHNPAMRFKFATEGQEFFFVKSVHFILPTPHLANNLKEFAQTLERVSVRSLYYHIFHARLRIRAASNDFAMWIDQELGMKVLAIEVARMDPYAHSLEALRAMFLSMLWKHIDQNGK